MHVAVVAGIPALTILAPTTPGWPARFDDRATIRSRADPFASIPAGLRRRRHVHLEEPTERRSPQAASRCRSPSRRSAMWIANLEGTRRSSVWEIGWRRLGGRLPAPMEASTNSSWVGAHDMTTTTSTSGTAITSTPVEGARAPIPAATCLARTPSMSARLSAYHPCRLVLPAGRPREGRAALRFACARQRCSSPQPPAAGSLSIARPPSPARSRSAPRARHVRGARRRHALRGRDPHCDRCRLQICPGRHRHRHQRHRHADVREGRVMRGYLRTHLRQRRSCHRQVQQLRMRLPGLGARHPVPGIGTLSCQSRSLQLELGPELARSERDERLQGRDEYLRAGSLDDLSFGEAPRNQPSIRRRGSEARRGRSAQRSIYCKRSGSAVPRPARERQRRCQ